MTRYMLLTAAVLGALAGTLPSSVAQAKVAVDAERITRDVKVLSSDAFEGRAPGTKGEESTIGYLIARMQDAGLEPGGPDGQWLQTVPLLHTTLGQGSMRFAGPRATTR